MSITQEQWKETIAKTNGIFQEAEEEFLTTRPMWMRLNLLAIKVSNGMKKGCVESDINWDKINGYLTQNINSYDFNCFGRITSASELFDAAANSKVASILGMWQKHTCKDCGEEFYLEYSEVEFFQGRGLNIPKRCKGCRTKNKNHSSVQQTPLQQQATPRNTCVAETPMQLAMRKAMEKSQRR